MIIYDASGFIFDIQAGQLNQDASVPDLLFYEVGNFLYKNYVFKKILSQHVMDNFVLVLNEWENVVSFDNQKIASILAISSDLGLSFYDASYVFLAKHYDAQLITADKALYEKAGKMITVIYRLHK